MPNGAAQMPPSKARAPNRAAIWRSFWSRLLDADYRSYGLHPAAWTSSSVALRTAFISNVSALENEHDDSGESHCDSQSSHMSKSLPLALSLTATRSPWRQIAHSPNKIGSLIRYPHLTSAFRRRRVFAAIGCNALLGVLPIDSLETCIKSHPHSCFLQVHLLLARMPLPEIARQEH
jgi:hypothetical protein